MGCITLAFAGPPALLSINVDGDVARATRLPQYDPRQPIAVSVTDRKASGSLTLIAVGPAGESLRVPLAPRAAGIFAGSLTLADSGEWQVRLIARNERVETGTEPIVLEAAEPPPSNAPFVGFTVGASIFFIVGGGGFVLLRRAVKSSETPAAELQAAA